MPDCFQCTDVSRRFGSHAVLSGVHWKLEARTVAGLVGPSGAGKTTLLRMLAGLDQCSSGQIETPAANGGPGAVGMVFQNLALWPHLTARQHVEAVLDGPDRRAETDRVLTEVQLPTEAWSRRPEELSGGEAQRLALARALAPRPQLLLLDEPLAQVDPALKRELLALVRELAQRRDTTTVYVTHSWPEVLELCQRVAVLIEGRIAQEGPLVEVYFHPADAAIAALTGPVVELPRQWIAERLVQSAVADHSHLGLLEADRLIVRPQQVDLVDAGATSEDRPGWEVVDRRLASGGWLLTLSRGEHQFEVVRGRAPPVNSRVEVLVSPPE